MKHSHSDVENRNVARNIRSHENVTQNEVIPNLHVQFYWLLHKPVGTGVMEV